MTAKKIDWQSSAVVDLLKDDNVTVKQKAELLGVSYWYISRKRIEMGMPRRCTGGYGHKSTNQERKARYNAKIKKQQI